MKTGNFLKGKSWIVGHFARPPFKTNEFEIKLSQKEKGEHKDGWGLNHKAQSLCVLLKGRIVLEVGDKRVVLKKPGDYVYWGPGVPHTWKVIIKSFVLSVRWPSIPNDQLLAHDYGPEWTNLYEDMVL